MALSDKALGAALLALSIIIFVYYSSWTLLLPFVASDHPIHGFFPAREYAIAIPAALFILFLLSVSFFIGFTMAKEARKNKDK